MTSVAVVLEDELDELRIPAESHELEAFRRWVHSPEFPERGRIDYLEGDIEVDVSPEDLYTHGTTKAEIGARLHLLVADRDLGAVFVDRARITHPGARLSAEPDVAVVLWASLEAGRIEEVAAASGKPGRYIELEGTPDLIVEVVSDSSARKDRERLPRLYAAAGVPELWLIDARGEPLGFEILTLERGGYRAAEPDAEGWCTSPLLAARLRLLRRRAGGPHRWAYRLESRPVTR